MADHQNAAGDRTVGIAQQGWRFVIAGLAVDLVGMGLVVAGGLLHKAWSAAVGGVCCALGTTFAAFCLYFFRDPDRPSPADAGKIYAPGEGVVLSVAREGAATTTTVRIFLSIFDVHVQRSPCAGRVAGVRRVEGSFLAAMKDEARGNVRSVLTLEPAGRTDPLVVEQIAGLVARRIETWPKAGDSLAAGQRYGIIYFGSQVAVHLPGAARAVVKPGDRVVCGATPIAEWTS